jgi:hypothetical protein
MNRSDRRRPWLALSVLAAGLLACGSPGTARTAPEGDRPSPAVEATAAAPSSPTPPGSAEPDVFSAADPAEDCWNGFLEPTECAGVDMTNLIVGRTDAAAPGRLVFEIEFAEDLMATEEFGVFLYFDLDQHPATGVQRTGLPGVERLIGASPPTSDTWTQDLTAGDYDAEIVRDDALVTTRIEDGRLMFVVDPALLADSGGGAPDGFIFYAITARGIQNEDAYNAEEDLHVTAPMTVPDEVVTQAP